MILLRISVCLLEDSWSQQESESSSSNLSRRFDRA